MQTMEFLLLMSPSPPCLHFLRSVPCANLQMRCGKLWETGVSTEKIARMSNYKYGPSMTVGCAEDVLILKCDCSV